MTSMLSKVDWSTQARRALKPTEIVTRLAAAPGWSLTGDGADVAIQKTYTFANYYETISFVNALAFRRFYQAMTAKAADDKALVQRCGVSQRASAQQRVCA